MPEIPYSASDPPDGVSLPLTLQVAHTKLSYSRAFIVRAYLLQTHEMLFDAHNHAFRVFGGIAAGVGAVLITMASKSLLNRGRKFGAVLAHRFYLILPISLVMTWGADIAAIDWSSSVVAALLVVSVVGVLAPLYLL